MRDDPEAYRSIIIPLEYIETPKAEGPTLGALTTALEKDHPDFKHYGQMMSNNSFDLSDRAGVRKGDNAHFYNIGVGYGFGKMMLGYLDFMPFLMAEFDDGEMSDAKASSDDDNKKKLRGYFIRVPLGVRLNLNIVYPLRLTVEAGYALHYGLGLIKETGVLQDALRDIGANRGGFFVAAGLLF